VIRRAVPVAFALLMLACTRSSEVGVATSSSSPTPSLAHVPDGVPPSFEDDVGPENVPVAALIPLKSTAGASWTASTESGDAIVVAWEFPGEDPFHEDRGVVAWRRFDDGDPPWRPVWGVSFPARRTPVLGVDTQLADVTGDGSTDAVVFASTGGSGGCGTTFVVDLAAGTQAYRSAGCDRTIEPTEAPAGLLIREAVYAPGDPHCCPSAFRETTLVYNNGTWQTASTSVSPV
jgi:hypothetical protein